MPYESDDRIIKDQDNFPTYFRMSFNEFITDGLTINGIFWMVGAAIIFLLFRSILNAMISQCHSKSIHYMPRQRAVQMIKYFNPFEFELHHNSARYAGIKCTLSSVTDCIIVPLWGVPIYDLFKLINEINSSNFESLLSDVFPGETYNSSDIIDLCGEEKLTKEFVPPKCFNPLTVQSSHSPRVVYPFALIMISKTVPEDDNSQLVLLANIIHLPDEIVRLPVQVYQQCVKSSNGYVAIVKKIYPESFEHEEIGNSKRCVVCMDKEISVVVLPCGHTCVCYKCFEQCENCPICRGPANFYFVSNTVSKC